MVLKYLFCCNILTKHASSPLNFYILKVRHAIVEHVTKMYFRDVFMRSCFLCFTWIAHNLTVREAVAPGAWSLFRHSPNHTPGVFCCFVNHTASGVLMPILGKKAAVKITKRKSSKQRQQRTVCGERLDFKVGFSTAFYGELEQTRAATRNASLLFLNIPSFLPKQNFVKYCQSRPYFIRVVKVLLLPGFK